MSNLKRYKFSDLYEMSSGISTKPEQAGKGSPFVSFKVVFNNYFLPTVISDLMHTSEKEQEIYSIKEGDIFLTRTSETLDELAMSCVAIKEIPKATYSGFLKRLRPIRTGISYHKFMAFYLRSELFRKTMSNNAIMTLRASFNEQIFSYLDLILPEFDFQKKAGDFLYSLNQKIDLNNRINAELEAIAKTIYDYWFLQFDFPDKNGKPYKSSGGKMVWNDELKREVPEGWEVGNLFDIAELIRGVSYDKSQIRSEYDKDVIPILRATNITKNIIDLNQMVFVPSSVVGENQILNLYDILITMSSGSVDHIGKNAFYFYNRKVSYGAFCAKLVAKKDFIFYLYSYMQSEFLSSTLKNECLGTNINNLNSSMVYGFKVVLPNNLMILKFNNIVACYYKMMGNNLNQNQQLASLRDWLLPMLMNGQVSVGED